MRIPTNTARLLLASILLVPWGCSLSRHAPAQRHYVLGEGLPAGSTAPASDSGDLVIGLRRPRLAAYLEAPFIVVRRAPHRVELSEFHRWGEELARGISRTLAGHLADGVPTWRIEITPWDPGIEPDYLIQIHLLRFEGVVTEGPEGASGEAHVQASWEILRPSDGALVSRGATDVREEWTVGDFDGLIRQLDLGLATLANTLRTEMERVHLTPRRP